VLFFIGLVIAITFNVDVLEIAGKISTDKDARDKLVDMAIKAADTYKDDPRVKKLDSQIMASKTNDSAAQHQLDSIKERYTKYTNEAKAMLDGDIKEANNLLAIGWGDYGLKVDSANNVREFKLELNKIKADLYNNTLLKPKGDTAAFYTQKALEQLYKEHWIRFKVTYVLKHSLKGKKKLGFLLLAFAVCLGAPFWFDLLQKLIKIRAAGKKEDTQNTSSASPTPVQVTLNNHPNTEEAVG
jgi:hypothetical protein